MKIELEHGDICKALAYYLLTKNFSVEPDPRNFVFKEEEDGELLVIVKNGDMGAPSARSAPTQPLAAVPASRPREVPKAAAPPKPAAKARIFARNDPFEPIPPPREQVPAPRQKILDPQAARSPAMLTPPMHPGMPAPRAIIQDYGTEKKGEALVEDEESPALTPSGLIVDPAAMSEEDQKLFQDILARAASQTETGGTPSDADTTTAHELDMMGAGELIE